jgi:hypothetical protein
MRVVLTDNLLFEDTEGIYRYALQPHLGLISLIAVLEQHGHEGRLVDPKIQVARGVWALDQFLYKKMANEILALNPDVVGMTSLGCNFICTVKVASYLKHARPDLPILLGGPHASVLDRPILQGFPQFDVILRQEGERNIIPLIESLPAGDLKQVSGITYRRNNDLIQNPSEPVIQDLDSLPIPAYQHYPIRELNLTHLRVDAGRGCPFQCTFCSTAAFFGRKYRLKSAGRLISELDFLHTTYGISDFSLTHDLFTVDRQKVKAFCEAVEGRGYTWKCSARMDCVDRELLERMAAAGCRSIYYGIETGSDRMQQISKKRLDLQLFNPTLSETQHLGMSATVSFITGYPEETAEDQAATLDMIASCFSRRRTPINVQLHLLTPEPGTELLAEQVNQIAYDGHISDFNFPNLEPDDGELIQNHPNVFINHHYFPSVLPRRRHIFVTQIYQTLYALGFTVLQYMLRFFGGDLSLAIDRMYAWHEREAYDRPIDNSFLESFLRAYVGKTHHLSGLVSYMCRASELRRVGISLAKRSDPEYIETEKRYRLSSGSRLVRSVPDCPKMIDFLETADCATSLPLGLLRSRRNFLLQLIPDTTDTVMNFVLSDAATTAIETFSRPQSLSDFSRDFPRDTGYPVPPVRFLNALIERRILESV